MCNGFLLCGGKQVGDDSAAENYTQTHNTLVCYMFTYDNILSDMYDWLRI